MAIKQVIEIFERLNQLQIKSSRLAWTQYTVGFDFGIEEVEKEINSILVDERNFEIICEYREKDLEPMDRRRVEIAYNIFKPYHLSKELNEINLEIRRKTNELSKILNTFRFKIEGRETTSVEIDQILSKEEDRELRRKAYFSRNQINEPLIEGGFIELINLRKEFARLYGSEDFVEYMLERDELSPSIFEGWKEELKGYLTTLKDKRRQYANKYLKEEEMFPWDEGYIKSKISPSSNAPVDMSNYYNVLRDFFLNFGIDIDEFNITYDIFPRRNKSEWGYNFTIETGKDSRILANVKNRYNEYGVLLHETGHGVHSFLKDPTEILLNSGISGIITEGIANLFGSFLYDKMFYGYFFDDGVEEEFKEARGYGKLNYLRLIGDMFFDHELYRNPISSLEDIYGLYFKTYGELFGDRPYDEAPPFGYRIHHTTHPIYIHNYIMGDVTCEMLRKVFCKNYGVSSISEKAKEFGQFLIREVISPSGLYKFEELFKRISGEEFSLKWYLE